MNNEITQSELAAAFNADDKQDKHDKPKKPLKAPKQGRSKKQVISFATLIIGILCLVAGLVFLLMSLLREPAISDGDYLVSTGEWVLNSETDCTPTQDEGSCPDSSYVIWQFTEPGKGKLTTNNHLNDYDFTWALDKDTLKIRTDWLYELDNEYSYELRRDDSTLILSADGQEYRFVAKTE